jgi:MFS superfamily sulfate permease-like transporter
LFSHGSNNHIAGIIGLVTIFVFILWQNQPYKRLKVIPGSLVAVIVATICAQYFNLPIRYVELPDNLFSSVQFVDINIFKYMSNYVYWLEALALAFVASAETLLTATAIDRMQSGKRTNYDRELASQGIGNFLCGLIGALPLNGVIVRSSANVQAGAKTRMSTILHGLWLLVFVSFFPSILRMIPLASLAALLVYTGFKLINIQVIRSLYPYGRAQVGIYFATVITIISSGLLTGVLTGFVLSVLHLLYIFSHLEIKLERDSQSKEATLFLKGSATFLSLPKLASSLEEIESDWQLHVHLEELDYIDHACLDLLMNWESQHNNSGGSLIIDWKTLGAKFHERRSRNVNNESAVQAQSTPQKAHELVS